MGLGQLFVTSLPSLVFPSLTQSRTDSDSQGRTPAFNLTLLLTSIFGMLSAFAPSFFWLCVALFGLGTGVGGSMPTDGTLFLENIPKTHHYLLTALSAL